jgi:hypothetical protein
MCVVGDEVGSLVGLLEGNDEEELVGLSDGRNIGLSVMMLDGISEKEKGLLLAIKEGPADG